MKSKTRRTFAAQSKNVIIVIGSFTVIKVIKSNFLLTPNDFNDDNDGE